MITFNTELAKQMGWNADAVEYFSGNEIFEGKEAIAMAHSGLEFGGFSPQLGDGRSVAFYTN